MKSIISFLMLIFSVQCCYAQETHVIEPAELEITFSTKEYAFWDTYTFRCGKNVSQYFSISELQHQKMLADDDPALFILWDKRLADYDEPDPAKRLPASTGNLDEIYRNLEQGKFTTYSTVVGTHYLITEDVVIPEWTMYEDSTITVLGMECKKATTNFRGRYWEVWYTEDIPISQGPWKLCGLPGMILKANSPKFMLIEATGIKNKNLEPVTFYNYLNYKYAPIDRMEYLKKVHKPGIYPTGGSRKTIEIDDKI
ncbi:GLPGLI family protein [Prevotella intermedia]|uniref:GLPGLI family protein n=1 Tax=Prevotella intermedia TaxID=28131 RepID=UPI000C1BDFE4|nr:GLPGLI family protein [Prevotella intermedia]ATV28482.1 GLPGLI family protein [Prevotella intermedia]